MSDKKDSSKSPRDTNGPVVKSGPTAGQNRSRNDDGSWRKKRSDTGKSRKKSGCFITTATCNYKGLPDNCHELETLRKFRDGYLIKTNDGLAMVEHYYSIAPAIAEKLTDTKDLEAAWQVICQCIKDIESQEYLSAVRKYSALVDHLELKLISTRKPDKHNGFNN